MIYGNQEKNLNIVMNFITDKIKEHNDQIKKETSHPIFEHLSYRLKAEESMIEKCERKGLPVTPESALRDIQDAIGIRVITRFVEDVYVIVSFLKTLPNCSVVIEKDYIKNPKPNGYRSYHMVLQIEYPLEDIDGNNPGTFYYEVQLRTIAMDCWASLEHEMKYKKDIDSEKIVLVQELKRCADELAACDITMNTIRNLLRKELFR